MSVRRLAFIAAVAFAPSGSVACTPPDPDVNEDRPVVLYSDGSFVDAASDDYDEGFQGNPARDVGGGRVGQIVTTSYTCYSEQWLLVVDCTTGSAIAVQGLPPDPPNPDLPFLMRSTLELQVPRGPLALGPSTTVAEVAALAAREGWSVRTDVPGWAAERGRRNRFDPFMGCRVLYPGSPGAGG